MVSTLVGLGVPGSLDGIGTLAALGSVGGIVIDSTGSIIFSDSDYNSMRKISTSGEHAPWFPFI